MAHGEYRGIFHGEVRGDKHNTGIFGIQATKDATSGIYTPATTNEWNSVLTAAGISSGAPSALHLWQEASGNIIDQIGTFTLTASGSVRTYQVSVSGWSRKAVTNTTDGGTTAFQNTDAGLPDLSAASMATIAYILFPTVAPAAARTLISQGTSATRADASITTAPVVRGISTPTNITNGVSNPVGASTVRPVVVMSNKTGSIARVYTNQDKISPTFGAVAGKNLLFGSGAIAGGYMYSATFFNTAAELTDGQWKSLLTTLGWSIPW